MMTPDDVYTTAVRIDAPPAEVFPYLTDAELMVRWMGEWAELQPKPGGRLAIDINGVPIRGEYLVVEPPHRVVFSWVPPAASSSHQARQPSRSCCARTVAAPCSSSSTEACPPRSSRGTGSAGATSSSGSSSPRPVATPGPIPGGIDRYELIGVGIVK